MKKISLLISFSIVISLLPSCIRNNGTQDVICDNGSLSLYPAGFDSTDFNGSITLRYKNNGAFDSLIDTMTTSYEVSRHDTGYLKMDDTAFYNKLHITDEAGVTAGYDYKIVLPSIGKTYLLTNIAQSGITHHAFPNSPGIISIPQNTPQCFNNISSININGNKYSWDIGYQFSTAMIYLIK